MSAISAIYFLDRKGRIIIFQNYRGEVVQDISEGFSFWKFRVYILDWKTKYNFFIRNLFQNGKVY